MARSGGSRTPSIKTTSQVDELFAMQRPENCEEDEVRKQVQPGSSLGKARVPRFGMKLRQRTTRSAISHS
jgi:hypothetical protein